MAVATTTALAIGSLAATAGTTGASFIQAGKQNRLRRQAEAAAEKAMAEAKKRTEVNVYEQVGIQKEPYKIASEAMLSQSAQAIQALREGESRGSAVGVGRVQMAAQEAQQQIREAMGKELMGLEMATAEEEGRLLDIGTQLNLEEVAGAQQAAAQAEDARRMAMQQGIQGIGSMVQQGIAMAPLYEKGAAGRQLGRLERTAARQGLTGADLQKNIASLGSVGNVDFSGVGAMTPDQFSSFMLDLKPDMLRSLRQKLPQTISSFNESQRRAGLNLPSELNYVNRASEGLLYSDRTVNPGDFNYMDVLSYRPRMVYQTRKK